MTIALSFFYENNFLLLGDSFNLGIPIHFIMENLHIHAEKKKPGIAFEKYSGSLKITGNSSIENPDKFYEEVVNWLDEYTIQPAKETVFSMQMEYFNSSSAKHLMRLFRVLERAHADNKTKVLIKWYHNEHDGSMLEAGEDYASMLKVPFTFIEEADI
ncbi:MAG: DUF1987 domain-containing protein [Vicingaceae bacterium]